MQNKDPGTYQLISTELQKPRNYKSASLNMVLDACGS